MKLLRELLNEIYSMFAGDLPMSLGVAVVVAVAAAIRYFAPVDPSYAALELVVGSLIVLIWRVCAARRPEPPRQMTP
jgi:hypothetical protein